MIITIIVFIVHVGDISQKCPVMAPWYSENLWVVNIPISCSLDVQILVVITIHIPWIFQGDGPMTSTILWLLGVAISNLDTLWWTNIAMENGHFSWENPLFRLGHFPLLFVGSPEGNSQVALLGRETCTPQTRSAATLPGSTPLLAAAGIGSEELVELLMSYGAYPQVNDRGESCEFLAEANGHYNVLPCFQTVAVWDATFFLAFGNRATHSAFSFCVQCVRKRGRFFWMLTLLPRKYFRVFTSVRNLQFDVTQTSLSGSWWDITWPPNSGIDRIQNFIRWDSCPMWTFNIRIGAVAHSGAME